ncbi:MAG: hypothetical protein H7289_06330 [Mucilaginibacter sp.]|nr:hypothetical protein [Mucilaginibacter sp.]
MKALSFIALVLLPFFVRAQDMQKYERDTRDLVKAGKYKEALERDIWFHNHALEYDKAMVGVRLSFALSDWKTLGDKYPPALAALKKMRDDKTKIVTANGGPPNIFQDVVAINRTFKEDAKSIQLFQTVIKTHPSMAQGCWPYVKRNVLAAKQFNIARNYIGNPVAEFNAVKKRYDSNVGYYPKMIGLGGDLFKKLTEKNFVNESAQLIQYTTAVNDTKSAKEIQHQADVVIADGRIEEALKK